MGRLPGRRRAHRAAPWRPPAAAHGRASTIRESRGPAARSSRTQRWRARSAGRHSAITSSASALARDQRSPRCMLALVSIKTAIRAGLRRRGSSEPPAGGTAGRTRTPAGTSAAARRRSRSRWSSRLRRVSRGGDGERNISELNGTSPLRRPADQVEHDRGRDRQRRRGHRAA